MANLGLKERYDFQQWIIKDLKDKNGYIQRNNAQYNPRLAMDENSYGIFDGDQGNHGLSP